MRRGVLRALGAYVIAIWLLAQGLVDLLPAVGFPDWAIRVFLAAAIALTPFVAIVAWKYDLTSRGFLRDKQDVARRLQQEYGGVAGPTTRVSPAASGTTLIATWQDEKGAQHEQEFGGRIQVGRDMQADIRLLDDRVSRRHLDAYAVGDKWYVRDLSSLNGSYVNGKPIELMEIDESLEVAFDRTGPRVRFRVRNVNDTMVTARSEDMVRNEP